MLSGDDILLAAIAQAPRRYGMPALPTSVLEAVAQGPDVALSFAVESARVSLARGRQPGPDLERVFTSSLAKLIAQAIAPAGGDPSYRAQVLRSHDSLVQQFVELQSQSAQDSRRVRTTLDALGHPGKLRHITDAGKRRTLAALHELAQQGHWEQLRDASGLARRHGHIVPELEALLSGGALARLERLTRLEREPSVQRYVSLCRASGPAAGSDAAAAQGRASANVGRAAEDATVAVLGRVSAALNTFERRSSYAAVHSLRMPSGFPGDAAKAKDEWDCAIVRTRGGDADLLLVVEVKASPSAATSDFSRMLRGLKRFAQARTDASYEFGSSEGPIAMSGASLQALEPAGYGLPARAIYCSTAEQALAPSPLATSTKAVLLTQPPCLAYAQALLTAKAEEKMLAPLWAELLTSPRLRSALHQFETARAVRDAMMHPDDLLQAFFQARDLAFAAR